MTVSIKQLQNHFVKTNLTFLPSFSRLTLKSISLISQDKNLSNWKMIFSAEMNMICIDFSKWSKKRL